MAAQIFNLEALQPLSDCCACFVKGKETGRDFEYAQEILNMHPFIIYLVGLYA